MKLVYVNPIGKNSNDKYEYEFFFSNNIEKVYGDNWDYDYPNFCGDMKPYDGTYDIIKKLVTEVPFSCAQQNTCFSMKNCIEGCIAVCYENISDYDAYPEPYRIVFKYGEDIESVIDKLNGRNIGFE